jgi:hypothetical protein
MRQLAPLWSICSLLAVTALAGVVYASSFFYPLRVLCFFCLGHP